MLVGIRKFYFKLKICALDRISPLSNDENVKEGNFGKVSTVPFMEQ